MKTREMKALAVSSVSAAAMLVMMGAAAPALAAEAPAPAAAPADAGEPGAIVVTARKRSEDILKVPVTVTAMTGAALEQRGVVSMQDVASSTPGININNSSSGHADRSFQQVVLRGFTPSSTLATTTSLFIDGSPVASPSAFTAISDPDRVEILKGPQSAYFGRNTFAGAINVVNKLPTDTWHASLMGMFGTRDNTHLQGSIEGPIFGDTLTFRITGDRFSKSGSWVNSFDGKTLGDQKTTSGTALFVFKPTTRLTVKLFGMLSQDDDGPSAQTRLYAYNITGSNGQVIAQNQANCSFKVGTATNPYICGVTPSPANPVSYNTAMFPNLSNWLSNPTNRVVNPSEGVQGYGLLRNTRHAHTNIDYKFSDSLSGAILAGYNREVWSTLIDLDGLDTSAITMPTTGTSATPQGYFNYPYLIERKTTDYSVEGRMSFNSGPFRAVAGVSFLDAIQYAGGGGTYKVLTSSSLVPGGKSENKTTGLFFGLTYDVLPGVSASFEGRYQIDDLTAYAGPNGVTTKDGSFIQPKSLLAAATYKNFSPRAIVNWQINPRTMVYASWAKGVNPAQFNTGILSQTAAVQAAAAALGGQIAIRPEKITNYEVGMKGKLLNGNLRYTLAAYYAQWRDEINSVQIVVPDSTQTTGYSFVTTYNNAGSVDLYGVEGDMSWKVSPLITIDAAAAMNASRILKFNSAVVTALTGVSDFHGKEMKNTSKYSANIGVTFGGGIKGLEDSRWFWRTDWNYKSGMWSNEANTTRTPDLHIFNMRAGVSKGKYSIDVFVNNLFNNHTPVSISDNYTIDNTLTHLGTYSAVLLGLPELRTVGVQGKVKF